MLTAQPKTSTPMKAIRAKCMECSNFSPTEVRDCVVETCALHAYRLGKNPHRKPRVVSDEQRERLRGMRLKQLESQKIGANSAEIGPENT